MTNLLEDVEKQKIDPFVEVGDVGLKRWSSTGLVDEEYDTNLKWPRNLKIYAEMERSDSMVGAGLLAIKMLIRDVEWFVEAGGQTKQDVAAAELVDTSMHDMSHTWSAFIVEVLSKLAYGFSLFEDIYKKRSGPDLDPPSDYDDGRIGWRKLAFRAQETVDRWLFDEKGGVQGILQVAPPIYARVPIPIGKLLLFTTERFKTDPNGRSLLRAVYKCYSEDTEVLTMEGWKPIATVESTDQVATLNPISGELEYQQPTARYAYPYRGPMVHQSGKFIDLLVTPNHRMYCRPVKREKFEFIEARDLPKIVAFKRDAVWHGQERAEFKLPAVVRADGRLVPERTIPMDDWLRFFGIWLAEGCATRVKDGRRQSYVILTQKAGPKLDQMIQIADRLGYKYQVYPRDGGSQLWISNLQLYQYLSQFGHADAKFIPTDLKQLSPRQLTILLDAVFLGDGTHMGKVTAESLGTRVWATVSRRLADDIAELLLKAGMTANIRLQSPCEKFGRRCYLVSEIPHREGGHWADPKRRKQVDYDGTVYCLEVPNHTLYVRRNGKAVWCGNSWYFRKNLEVVEAIALERQGAGYPVWKLPQGSSTSDDAASDVTRIKKLLRNLRQDQEAGIIVPFGHEFSFASTTANLEHFSRAIQRHKVDIAMGLLAEFLLLGMQDVGSRALGDSKMGFFQVALGGWLNMIADTLNRFAVKRLLRLNPDLMAGLTKLPKIAHTDPGKPDLMAMANLIEKAAGSGALTVGPEIEEWLRKLAGMPERPELPLGATPGLATPEGVAPEPTGEDASNPKGYAAHRGHLGPKGPHQGHGGAGKGSGGKASPTSGGGGAGGGTAPTPKATPTTKPAGKGAKSISGVAVHAGAAELFEAMPEPLRKAAAAAGLKEVQVVSAADMKKLTGPARGGAAVTGTYKEDGRLFVLKRDTAEMRSTLHHEMAHALDPLGANGKFAVSESREWQAAAGWKASKGSYKRTDSIYNRPVSDYGRSSPWEDFAETFRVMTTGTKFERRVMQGESEGRYAFMQNFLKEKGVAVT